MDDDGPTADDGGPDDAYPCGHTAITRGCGGCDAGAVDVVLDDAGHVVWRATDDDQTPPEFHATWAEAGAPDPGARFLAGLSTPTINALLRGFLPAAQGRPADRACIVGPDEGSPDVPDYQPQVMHRAVCQDCRPVLPRAFDTAAERDQWVLAHITHSEHRVFIAPDPTPTSTADEALAAVERAHEALTALVVSLHDPDHPTKENPR